MATYSIWGGADPPDGAPTQASDSAALTLGTAFTVSEACDATTIRFYFGSGWTLAGNTPVSVALFQAGNATPLASAAWSGDPAAGWNDKAITRTALAVGTTYVAAVFYDGATNGGSPKYSATSAYFTADRVSGIITAPGGAAVNGRYTYASTLSEPVNEFNDSSYYSDVIVDTSSTTTTTALRPDATVSNGWTVTGPATAHEALDEAVTQPTAPDTATDHVSTDTAGAVCEVAVADKALASGESVSGTDLWVYAAGGSKRSVTVDLRHGTTSLGTVTVAAGAAAGWVSVASAVELTQAQVNDLRCHLTANSTGGGPSSAATAYAAYVDLTTTGGATGQTVTLTPAVTTGTAQALTASKPIRKSPTPATTADTTQALSVQVPQSVAITPATTTATPQALAASKTVTAAPALEANAAQALTARKPIAKALAPASTTDTAQLLDVSGPISVALTPAAETDPAQALSATKPIVKTATHAATTDSAQVISVSQPQSVTVTPAATSDTAQPLSVDKPIEATLAPASTLDDAQPTAVTKTIKVTLTSVSTTDVSQALVVSKPGSSTLVPATTTDAAQPLSVTKTIHKTVGPASTTDTAQPLSATGPTTVSLTPAFTTDSTQPLSRSKQRTLSPAVDSSTAQVLTTTRRVTLTQATTTDQAQGGQVTKPIWNTLIVASTTDAAQTLAIAGALLDVTATIAVRDTPSATVTRRAAPSGTTTHTDDPSATTAAQAKPSATVESPA